MCRWAIGLIVIAVAGCQGSPAPFGPYGPTQVPPPPTGTAGRPDPYYRRSLASQDAAANYTSYAQSPVRNSRVTSDDYRNERAFIADRRSAADTGSSRFESGDAVRRGADADRSSYNRDDQSRERQLDWRQPDLAYRDSSLGIRSGMVRPRFVSSLDSLDTLLPSEPASFDRGVATTAGQLRSQTPLSAWTGTNTAPGAVARQPYNGWSR